MAEINPFEGEWIPTAEELRASLASLAIRQAYLEELLALILQDEDRD